jgi:hypothetical protein
LALSRTSPRDWHGPPGGDEIVRRLGLQEERIDIDAVRDALATEARVIGVGSLRRLAAQRGWQARTTYVVGKLLPPAAFLYDDDCCAQHSALALAHARLRWITRCAARLPRALSALAGAIGTPLTRRS